MTVRLREFDEAGDFVAISELLVRHHQPGNRDGNWLQPVWEYAYTHPWFDRASVPRIGLWEEAGRLVAAVTYESCLGQAFFHVDSDFAHLKPAMLVHAEERLAAVDESGRRLKVFVNERDTEFAGVLQSRGYRRAERGHRPMSTFEITSPFPPISLPDGFTLQSLADDNDLHKVSRIFHRGFNHPGEPAPDAPRNAGRMQSGPNYRKDLAVVVKAPSGEFVSYAGLWFVPAHRYAYVEPVATDPDYRRRGLGRTAVLEGIRRCGQLGATVAYVATDKPFYLSFGFRKQFTTYRWEKSSI